MSCEHALNLDQWKTFSENYKPMKVWLWLVYKFTKNCQIYRLFSEFIQTKKRYPTHLEKMRILTRKLLVISSGNFSWYLISVTAPLRFLCALKFSLKKDLVLSWKLCNILRYGGLSAHVLCSCSSWQNIFIRADKCWLRTK